MKRPAERRSYFPVYGTLHPGLGMQIGGCERWRRESDADAFDLVERDLVRAAVVEASGAGAFVVGHLLGDFEFAAVAEVFGDAGGTEAVAADLGFDAGVVGTSADHAVDVGLGHGRLERRPEGPRAVGKSQALGSGKGGGVILEVGLELVVAGHLVALATLFSEAEPSPAPLNEDVLGAHLEHRPHAGEGVDHQGAVAQPWERVRHDGIERSRASATVRPGVLPFLTE